MSRVLSWLTALLLCASTIGCGGGVVCPTPPESPRADVATESAITADRGSDALTGGDALQSDLRAAFDKRAPRNLLVLSGGTEQGAFGAGWLHGWKNAPSGRRPEFDVVTGVSTGALMATFAFVGRERDYESLRQAYTNVRDRDIFSSRFPLSIPFANSLKTTAPLKQLIRKYVTEEMLTEVAQAHGQNRRLYVGTVNLNRGGYQVWCLSKMAYEARRDGKSCRDRYAEVLRASAAIPVVFEPVMIDGELHVDAGTREKLFLRSHMLEVIDAYESSSAAAATPEAGDAAAAPAPVPTVWVIVNGKMDAGETCVQNNILKVGLRSLDVNQAALKESNLKEAYAIARLRDPPFEFRWTAIPAGFVPGAARRNGPIFDPKVMRQLFDEGERLVGQSNPWRTEPPGWESDRLLRPIVEAAEARRAAPSTQPTE